MKDIIWKMYKKIGGPILTVAVFLMDPFISFPNIYAIFKPSK